MKSITKEEIAVFDIEEYKGRIYIVDTQAKADRAADYLSKFNNIGFDTETRPSFKKGHLNEVALIQLATNDRCYLFRLNKIGFPLSLIKVLSDVNILKIGLSLKDDFTKISRRMKFTPKGFVDLQKIISQHDISDIGLQKIYAILFQKRISKGQQLSNWEAEELSNSQKKYAALDAWACLRIYEKLFE